MPLPAPHIDDHWLSHGLLMHQYADLCCASFCCGLRSPARAACLAQEMGHTGSVAAALLAVAGTAEAATAPPDAAVLYHHAMTCSSITQERVSQALRVQLWAADQVHACHPF
jgi:hypothetical protein